LILHLSVAICEIWLLYFTYSVCLVLSLKPGVTLTSHHRPFFAFAAVHGSMFSAAKLKYCCRICINGEWVVGCEYMDVFWKANQWDNILLPDPLLYSTLGHRGELPCPIVDHYHLCNQGHVPSRLITLVSGLGSLSAVPIIMPGDETI
jgi:hypothetical protein